MTDAWDYGVLAGAVEAWAFRLMQDRAEFLDRASAARLWFDEEYEPVVEMLREADMLGDGTETDAYLRVSKERYRLMRTHEWSEDVLARVREDERGRLSASAPASSAASPGPARGSGAGLGRRLVGVGLAAASAGRTSSTQRAGLRRALGRPGARAILQARMAVSARSGSAASCSANQRLNASGAVGASRPWPRTQAITSSMSGPCATPASLAGSLSSQAAMAAFTESAIGGLPGPQPGLELRRVRRRVGKPMTAQARDERGEVAVWLRLVARRLRVGPYGGQGDRCDRGHR